MRIWITFLTAICGSWLIIAPAAAQNPQQERMKSCNAEAGAKKLSGKPRKDFMSDCLAGSTARAPEINPQQQRMKDCNAQAGRQKLRGEERKRFMSSCLSGAAAPPPARVDRPTTRAPETSTRRAPETPTRDTRPSRETRTSVPSGAGQHATEFQAKIRCPLSTVVWVNLDSGIYHFKGYRNYGTTKNGAYMCEGDASAAGSRAAKNEKHP